MHSVKIPGSRYLLSLENNLGEWSLKIKLDNNIESEVDIPNLNKRSLHSKITSILGEMKIQVSPIQIDLMHKELTNKMGDDIAEGSNSGSKSGDLGAITAQLDQIMSKMSNLEKKLEQVTDRVDRLERMSSS